jgi:PAS domain S-box-containing protein
VGAANFMPGKISLEQLEAIAASLNTAAKRGDSVDPDDPNAEYPSIAVAPSTADDLLGADFSMYARAEAEHSAYINALTVNNPIAIVVLESNFRIQMVNPAFERLFQYEQSEILGQDLDSLIVPDAERAAALDLSEASRSGKTTQATVVRRRRDGELLDVQVIAVPLVVAGDLIGAFSMYEDITERRRAERKLQAAEAKYRALVEQLPAITYTAEAGANGRW